MRSRRELITSPKNGFETYEIFDSVEPKNSILDRFSSGHIRPNQIRSVRSDRSEVQIILDHFRSLWISSDHFRLLQVTSDHFGSVKITSDQFRSDQITLDHFISVHITSRQIRSGAIGCESDAEASVTSLESTRLGQTIGDELCNNKRPAGDSSYRLTDGLCHAKCEMMQLNTEFIPAHLNGPYSSVLFT
ncbi:unnamed protein product [Protopolystoma xenopodis]|uniref:Uncharacterized protein n=1 Tax=Protopolystoma xenopodis TaxID=117903 RepID=A0A3S5BVR1_9PLAT|nr:unnamed protein product [Protopolystoma xenopodis]